MSDHRDFARIFAKYGYVGVRKIGEGSYGMAVLVEDKEKTRAVCKMVNVSKASDKEMKSARREANLLARLKHPYIVRYRTFFMSKGWFGIVMDFCQGGDLDSQIQAAQKGSRRAIAEENVKRWFTQAALALSYLHGRNVLHRDLKPANLFLTESNNLQVGDFGISKVLASESCEAHTMVGTPYYFAPEVCQGQPYSKPADVWALGCILYQLCALKVPFNARSLTELVRVICAGEIPALPAGYPSELRQVCGDMMSRHAAARPEMEAIVERPVVAAVARALGAEGEREDWSSFGKTRYEIMDQFREFDLDGDGTITRDELIQVLKHIDASVWTDASIDALLSSADGNNDGRIQFDEFVQWLFGAGGGSVPSEMILRLLQMAQKALDNGNLQGLREALVRCRQAIDIGCLRISPPEASVSTCEALSNIATKASSLFDGVADDDRDSLSVAYDAVKQMGAVLHAAEQLVHECFTSRVARVAIMASQSAVRGVCFELADGVRLGQCPGGLGDANLTTRGARWEALDEGERILEVCGRALPGASPGPIERRPSQASERRLSGRTSTISAGARAAETSSTGCAAALELKTNRSKRFTFGATASALCGTAFQFTGAEGGEIEGLTFDGGTCTGVQTSTYTVRWTKVAAERVREALSLAASSVSSVSLPLSWRLGPEQGKYAVLQAMRFRLEDPFVPEVRRTEHLRHSVSMRIPTHWDMEGEMAADPAAAISTVEASPALLRELQSLVDASWFRGQGNLPARTSAPSGLELERCTRLQNWRPWVDFTVRQDEVKSEMSAGDVGHRARDEKEFTVRTERHLKSLAMPLDGETRTVWLFHSLSAAAAESQLRGDFDVHTYGWTDGKLYGRGIYFTECSNVADEDSTVGADGLRCLLLCRVVLGRVVHDDALLPDVVGVVSRCVGGPYHSVLGDRGARYPGLYREFVVYDKDQVYPEAVLWYRRKYVSSASGS